MKNKMLFGGVGVLVAGVMMTYTPSVNNYDVNREKVFFKDPVVIGSVPVEVCSSSLGSGEGYQFVIKGREEKKVEEKQEGHKFRVGCELLDKMLNGEQMTYEDYVELQRLSGEPVEYSSREDYEAGKKIEGLDDSLGEVLLGKPRTLKEAITSEKGKATVRELYRVGDDIFNIFRDSYEAGKK